MHLTKSMIAEYGPEPALQTVSESDGSKFSRALDWYGQTQFDQIEKFRAEIDTYMSSSKDFTRQESQLFQNVSDKHITTTRCAISRLINNGVKLDKGIIERHNESLKYLITRYGSKVREEESVSTKASIQQRMRNVASEHIGDIDMIIDMLPNQESKVAVYQYLTDKKVAGKIASIIQEYYQAVYDELCAAQKGVDKDLVEGYRKYSKEALQNRIELYESTLDDLNRYSGNKVQVRKPRKRKQKSAEQRTKKVKYLEKDDELKVVSITPASALYSQMLYTFNNKTRMLTMYVAKDTGGLNIKGTTIDNFDETRSISKKLRKPAIVLDTVVRGGKVALRNVLDDIKAKSKTPNGRINKDTLLLRSVK